MTRFIAVALFLVLGTFAVIYSMTRARSPHARHDHTQDGIGASLADAGDAVANKAKSSLGNLAKSAKATITGGKYSDTVSAGKNTADKFAKAVSKPNRFPKPNKSSIVNAKQSPAASGFAAKSSAFPKPTSYKSSPLPEVLRAKKPEPPARFAAIPSKPIIGSQGGFGELKKPVQPLASRNGFAAPKAPQAIANKADSLIRKTGDSAKQLLGDLAKAPAKSGGAVDVANRSLNKFAGRANQAFGNVAKSTQDVARRSFGAPAVNSSSRFGQPSGQPPSQAKNAFGALPQVVPAKAPSFPASTPIKAVPKKPDSTPAYSSSRFPANLRSGGPSQLKSNLTPASTTTVSGARRRTPASTVARPVVASRPVQAPARTGFNRSTGSASQSGSNNRTGPAARVAAVTRDVPGDRRLDGVQAPSLSIEKLSPQEIQVGEPADFQIVLRNVGRVAVDDVQVFDQIPVGTEFISATPNPTQTGNRQLTWDIGTLSPGVEKRITVKLKPTRPGEIGSVAQYTFAARSSMRTRVTQPVLEITHRSKPQILIGGDVLFDVIVTNKGDGPARDVLIQEDVPEQLDFRDGYREIEYEVGTLLPNQSRNVRLTLQAKKPGKCQNVIFVSANGGIKSQHKLNLEVIAPSLKAKSAGPNVRFLGREAKHSFSVSNSGTAPATNVELIARLPSGLRYLQSNNKGTYNRNLHAVVWELAELRQDIDASVEVVTEPIAVGNQPIKFEAKADLDMRAATEQRLSVEHLVDVFIDIDDVLDPVEIGGETKYRVQVVNQGTKVATNVRLQVDFPNGLKPTAVDGPLANQIRGQQVVFSPIESLKPGSRLSFVVSGQGETAGDHRVVLKMNTDGRSTTVSKEESTRVYADR